MANSISERAPGLRLWGLWTYCWIALATGTVSQAQESGALLPNRLVNIGQVSGPLPMQTQRSAPEAGFFASEPGVWEPYLQLHGGGVFLQDIKAISLDSQLLGGDAALALDANSGFAGGLALGVRRGDFLSLEHEFTYRHNDWRDLQFQGSALDLDDFQMAVDGGIRSYASMSNLKLELPGRWIRPYVGGGAGFAFFDSSLADIDTASSLDLSFPSFTYQGIAGVAWSLFPRLEVFTEYRYFAMTPVEFRVGLEGESLGAGLAYATENVFVGIRLFR